MTIYRARLKKDQLNALPADERELFLSLGHLANELGALSRALFWSKDYSSPNQAVVHGQISLSLLFLRLVAAKAWEGHRLLETKFFGPQVSKHYTPDLPQSASDDLRELNRYFGRGENPIKIIRNYFAFHYSPAKVAAILPEVPDDLDVYIEDQGTANALYYFSEAAAFHALLKELKVSERADLHAVMEEIDSVVHKMLRIAGHLMAEFIRRHADGLWEGAAEPVTFENLDEFLAVRIPWFTDITTLLKQQSGSGPASKQ